MPDEWFRADSGEIERAPAWLRPWLCETGSLTRRLTDNCDGMFGLVVLDERPGSLAADDAAVLGLPTGAGVIVREVQLCCDGIARIHARSVLPDTTLRGPAATLATLGDRPLGDALFTFPDLERGPIEVADTDAGWVRRSVFRVGGAPLLVSERFLPELQACSG